MVCCFLPNLSYRSSHFYNWNELFVDASLIEVNRQDSRVKYYLESFCLVTADSDGNTSDGYLPLLQVASSSYKSSPVCGCG